MKHALLALAFAMFASSAMSAEPSPACAAKRADIERQLDAATSQGRTREAAGLRTALDANKARCTDELLARKREDDIRQSRRKVAQREKKLEAAQRKGDAKKIARRQEELDNARRALADAQRPVAP